MNTNVPRSSSGSGTSGNSSPTESASHRISDSAHKAVDKFAEKAESLEAQVRSVSEKAGEQGEIVLKQARSYIQEHPMTVLGIAFVSGAILSALFKK